MLENVDPIESYLRMATIGHLFKTIIVATESRKYKENETAVNKFPIFLAYLFPLGADLLYAAGSLFYTPLKKRVTTKKSKNLESIVN